MREQAKLRAQEEKAARKAEKATLEEERERENEIKLKEKERRRKEEK